MFKFNVFFRKENGQIVEVQDQFNFDDDKSKVKSEILDNPTPFDIFGIKVIELSKSEYFNDAEIVASSFGPVNV